MVEGPYEFPGGRRFHFTDPAGNELGVWACALVAGGQTSGEQAATSARRRGPGQRAQGGLGVPRSRRR